MMCERVDQAHIKRAFQAGIEERIPTGALCHILRIHILCLCMYPEFGRRFRRRRRWDFFFRVGQSSFSLILPGLRLLYISSTHIRILREDEVNEMWIAPKKLIKHPFEHFRVIVRAVGSQMTSHLSDHSHSQPRFKITHDMI